MGWIARSRQPMKNGACIGAQGGEVEIFSPQAKGTTKNKSRPFDRKTEYFEEASGVDVKILKRVYFEFKTH